MRKLYRSKKNRLIAGVFGGIAEYFNVSATPYIQQVDIMN